MGVLLDRFGALGVRFDLLDGDRVRAYGTLTDKLRAAIRSQKPALLTELAAANDSTHFRWQVTVPGRDPFEVRVVPEPTAAQMQLLYPGATIEPLSDQPHRPPTQAEAAELRSFIALILPDADDTDRAEALAVALADPDAALTSFRALAADLHRNPSGGGRISPNRWRNPENEERMTEMTAIETTGNQLKVEQWLEIRKEAGLRIDPQTAEVICSFELTLDPYGVNPDLPKEYHQVGREYFARSPGSDIWVWFGDLPDETQERLWEMGRSKVSGRADGDVGDDQQSTAAGDSSGDSSIVPQDRDLDH